MKVLGFLAFLLIAALYAAGLIAGAVWFPVAFLALLIIVGIGSGLVDRSKAKKRGR